MAVLQLATNVSALLTPDMILPQLPARTKAEVLDALAAHVSAAQPHVDARRLAEALHERERISSTALEHGVAIPHARMPGLPAPVAVLARSQSGVPFDDAHGQPTHLFLLLVVAAEQPGSHLKLLAAAARLLSDPGCRSQLLGAESAAALLAALHEHEQRRGQHAA